MTAPVEILLVEDNPGDARLTTEALSRGRVANVVHVVDDGDQALAFLRRTGRYTNAPRPGVVLLDLNLPGLDGGDVLAAVRADPALRRLPIIVLTTSSADVDVARAYDLGANCFISKPVALESFLAAITSFERFWLSVVALPDLPS